jgi:hypothetical protein
MLFADKSKVAIGSRANERIMQTGVPVELTRLPTRAPASQARGLAPQRLGADAIGAAIRGSKLGQVGHVKSPISTTAKNLGLSIPHISTAMDSKLQFMYM